MSADQGAADGVCGWRWVGADLGAADGECGRGWVGADESEHRPDAVAVGVTSSVYGGQRTGWVPCCF